MHFFQPLNNNGQERGTQVIQEANDDDDEVMPENEEDWARAVQEVALQSAHHFGNNGHAYSSNVQQ